MGSSSFDSFPEFGYSPPLSARPSTSVRLNLSDLIVSRYVRCVVCSPLPCRWFIYRRREQSSCHSLSCTHATPYMQLLAFLTYPNRNVRTVNPMVSCRSTAMADTHVPLASQSLGAPSSPLLYGASHSLCRQSGHGFMSKVLSAREPFAALAAAGLPPTTHRDGSGCLARVIRVCLRVAQVRHFTDWMAHKDMLVLRIGAGH